MTINAGEFLIAFVAAMGIPSAIMGFIVWKLERKIAARDKRAEEQEEAQKDFFLLMVQSTGAAIALGEATAKAVQHSRRELQRRYARCSELRSQHQA